MTIVRSPRRAVPDCPLGQRRSAATSVGANILVELDAARLRQVRPARDVLLHEAAERVGRHRHRLDRLDRQLVAQVGLLQHRVERVVELLDHGSRHRGRAHHAIPLLRVEALEARLVECRHVFEQRVARQAGDRQRTHAPRADVRQRGGQAGEHRLRLATEQIVERWRDAAVRDVHEEDAGLLLEQLHRQVRQRPRTGRAVAQLPGLAARVVEQLAQRVHRQRCVDHQHVGRGTDHADRREVLDRVVRHLARGRRRAVRGDITLHQRAAVGHGARRGLAGDGAAAAADVVDHEGLVQHPAPALGDRAAHHVAAAAGGHRHDVADRFVG